MLTNKHLTKFISILILALIILTPTTLLAQQKGYTLLEPEVIGLSEGGGTETSFTQYASLFFTTLLVVASVLAVIMFTWGGIEYILSSIPGSKAEGKGKMYAAIAGLLLALVSWLILNTINPDLINFNLNLGERVGTGGRSLGDGGSSNNGGGNPTVPGTPISAPADPNCSNCVSLREQGATVADWHGINGPGRTDMVNEEVAKAIVWVQQQARSRHNLNTHVTAAHTNGVGHSAGSQHYQGRAVDLQPTNPSEVNRANLNLIANLCREAGLHTIIEGRHVHCDARS